LVGEVFVVVRQIVGGAAVSLSGWDSDDDVVAGGVETVRVREGGGDGIVVAAWLIGSLEVVVVDGVGAG
jgi:hypothetical protein